MSKKYVYPYVILALLLIIAKSAFALTFVEFQKDSDRGLDGVQSVTVSPDGNHVYAAGNKDDAVAVFSRDSGTGTLAFVEVQKDGIGGVDGLDGVESVSMSPDGGNVYAAGYWDDAVAVFKRDATTGSLTSVEIQKDGIGGVDGLDGVNSVTVSPDGDHVYTAASSDNAIAVFSRDSGTGTLVFVEVQKDGVGGVDGLYGAHCVTVSPDGGNVYVAGAYDDAVAVFNRDSATGALTFIEVKKDGVGGVDGLDLAYSVSVSPDGGHVYTAGAYDDAVAVFSRDAGTGVLTFVEVQRDGVGSVDGLDYTRSVTVSPDGGHVYAAGFYDDAVAVFSRDAGTGALTFVDIQNDGVGGVDGLGGATSVTVSSDGGNVYATGYGDDAVAVFSRDAGTGTLTFEEVQKDVDRWGVDGLDGSRSVTVSPDGNHVYAVGELDCAVAVFSRDAGTGALTFVEVKNNGVGGIEGLRRAYSVTVSPDGSHVYVAGYYDDAVVVFSRNAVTGMLTFVEMQKDGVGGVDGLNGAYSVTVSPDGNNVYVAGYIDGVAVFSRDAGTGMLTFAEVEREGGLDSPSSVTVSPDGRHVYVAGVWDNAVAVFSRDAGTGTLTFVEIHKDGIGGVDGLNGAHSVTVSPDGANIYAVGYYDNAVAVFSRDSGTGSLSFVEVQRDGIGGVDGLYGARSVTVSPDGGRVYAAGVSDNAMAVFNRHAVTGELSFVEVQRDGVGAVDGLGGIESVTVSPDGVHVYAAGANDDAVAVFQVESYNVAISKNGSGIGTITSVPERIVCGTDCVTDFVAGSTVTLTATPDEDSVFTGWSGDASGTGDAVLAGINSDKTVIAKFDLKTFTVTIDITGNGMGTLSHETLTVNYGDSLTVTATPDVSSVFTGWSGDASGTGDAVLTNITSDKTITATFTLKTFTVTMNTAGSGEGTLSHSSPQTVNYGESLTVAATPGPSSNFAGWFGDATGTGDAVLTNITSDKTIAAVFNLDGSITVTIIPTGNGSGTLSHETQTVTSGSNLTVTAVPDVSSVFDGWAGDASGTGDAVLTDITSDKTIAASFTLKTFTVTIDTAGTGTGTLSHSSPQTLNHGDNLTVTATPDAGSVFYGWSGDATGFGVAVLENIASDMTITATFNTRIPGDVNLDGQVELADAVLALQVLAGISDISVFASNDVNNDQRIGLQEAVYILRFGAGL